MAEPSPALLATIRTIDRFTDWTGTVFSWLSVPLVLAVTYEVDRALRVPRADDLGVRHHLHAVRLAVHAGRRLRPAQGRAYPHRLLLGAVLDAQEGLDRHDLLCALLLPELSHAASYQPRRGCLRLAASTRLSDQTPWRPLLWPFKARDAARLPAADDPGLLRVPQEPLHGAHRLELEHKEKVEV